MSTDEDLAERVAWLEQAVTQLPTHSTLPIALPPRPGLDGSVPSPAARELVLAGNGIQAIQQQHLDTGIGLAEATATVDSFAG